MVLTACGSSLSEAEMLDANAAVTRTEQGAAQRAGSTRGTTEELSDADGLATGLPGSSSGTGAGTGSSGGDVSTEPEVSNARPTGAEIVLGSFGTGAGPIGAQLAAIPIATRAWAADVNGRGGIGGRPVRIVYADDGGDPARALAIVRRMVEQDKVVAFLGTFGATTIQAVTPYLEERGVPIIGTEGGNPVEDSSPMVFNPQVGADRGVAYGFILSLVELSSARKVALLYCGEAETCINGGRRIKEFAPSRGVSIVYESRVSLAQPDFTAEMIGARNAGAEAVLVYLDVSSMVRVIRSADRQGWKPVFAGGVSLVEESFTKAATGVGDVIANSAAAPYMTEPMADYRAAVARYVPGGTLGNTGGSAWIAGKLFERVMADIPGAPTSATIVQVLEGLKGETVGGRVPPLTFGKGAHGDTNLCVVPVRFTGGQWTAPLGVKFLCA
jgi:branched-chain amino acid transport system substrate-binding protein